MSKFLEIIHSRLNTLLVVTTVFLVFSSILLVYSYSLRNYDLVKYNYEYAYLKTTIHSLFIVKPSMIYNYRSTISTNETYLSIANRVLMNVSIHYRILDETELGRAVSISIKSNAYSIIETEKWSKDYSPSFLFKNNTYYFDVDLINLLNVVNTIDSEIKTRSNTITLSIYMTINIIVRYSSGITKSYLLNPLVKIIIDSINNKVEISSSNTEKQYREEKTENKLVVIKPLNINSASLKKYTLYSTVSLALFLTLLLVFRLNKYSSEENYVDRLVKLSIPGKVIDYGGKTIVLINSETLFSLSKIYGLKPIYDNSERRFYLVIRDVIYTTSSD